MSTKARFFLSLKLFKVRKNYTKAPGGGVVVYLFFGFFSGCSDLH